MQQDAQMLANRINFLRLEDEKTWKKIQETRRRAQKLTEIKEDNEERLYMMYENKLERERALSEKRNQCSKLRERQKKEKFEVRNKIFNLKQEEAFCVKQQRDVNLRRICNDSEMSKVLNSKKKEIVFQDKMLGKAKILDFLQRKNEEGRNLYRQKIEDNEKIRDSAEKEVQSMEQLELELVRRLENTQFIQHHAVQQLDKIINSPGVHSVYNSMIKKRKNSNLF